MKFANRLIAVLCCVVMLALPVLAVDTDTVVTTKRIDLDDGGYIVEEIVSSGTARATSTKSGTKTSTRYSADNEILYAVKVTGTFSYNGTSAWATASSATVSIYSTSITYVSKSSSYSSNYAKATGTVTFLTKSESRTVTLYCDKNGNLS